MNFKLFAMRVKKGVVTGLDSDVGSCSVNWKKGEGVGGGGSQKRG